MEICYENCDEREIQKHAIHVQIDLSEMTCQWRVLKSGSNSNFYQYKHELQLQHFSKKQINERSINKKKELVTEAIIGFCNNLISNYYNMLIM